MAEMTPEYMRERWPGVFAAAPDPPDLDPLSEAIIAAQNQLDQAGWGRNYSEAVVLLAGHIATILNAQRAGGAHHARAGLVEVDYGRETGTSSFRSAFDQLLKRQPQFRIPGEP